MSDDNSISRATSGPCFCQSLRNPCNDYFEFYPKDKRDKLNNLGKGINTLIYDK